MGEEVLVGHINGGGTVLAIGLEIAGEGTPAGIVLVIQPGGKRLVLTPLQRALEMEGRIVADDGGLGNHRKVVIVHGSVRSESQVLRLNHKMEGEHGFHQTVRNVYVYPLLFSCYQQDAGVLASDAHGLRGKQRNHHIAVQGTLFRVIRIHFANDAQGLGTAGGLVRAGNGKRDGPPAIIRVGGIGICLPYFHILHDTGRGRNKFIRDVSICGRGQVRGRIVPVDVVIEGNVKLLLLGLCVNEGLGHPGLNGHPAGSVGDIRQRRGVDIGRYVGCFFGRSMAPGRNLVYLDQVLEVTEDRIVLTPGHQVHFIVAQGATGSFFFIRKG